MVSAERAGELSLCSYTPVFSLTSPSLGYPQLLSLVSLEDIVSDDDDDEKSFPNSIQINV